MDTLAKRKALAKARISAWKEAGLITQQLVEVSEDLLDYLPSEGTNFCALCEKDMKFPLRDHLRAVHSEEFKRENDLELLEQLMSGAGAKMVSVDCSLLLEPSNPGEWKIYEAFVKQLSAMGYPIHKRHTRPSSSELGRQPPPAGQRLDLPCPDQPSTSTSQQEAATASTNVGTRRRRKSGQHSKTRLLE